MEHEVVLFAELETASGLTRSEILELVEFGVLEPQAGAGGAPEVWAFPASALVLARMAARWRDDFELAPHSVALLFAYRDRMLELERRVRELECRLPR